jgi:hypothetical protein
MSVASLQAAHEFLTAGARPDAWEWLDEQGRALPSRLPDGVMVRLRRRTDQGLHLGAHRRRGPGRPAGAPAAGGLRMLTS